MGRICLFALRFDRGAGYDLRIGRSVSLTPAASFLYGSVGDLTGASGTAVERGWKQNVFTLALGVTFH